MRFRIIRLVEQTEQKLRRIRVCFTENQEKRVTVIVGLFYYIKAPNKNGRKQNLLDSKTCEANCFSSESREELSNFRKLLKSLINPISI